VISFRKLIIENFQSHAYTEIEFSDGLNVLVGPSDSGKSAVLRALRWVLFNTPRGTDMIRTGAKKCQVRLILQDGTEIIRERDRSAVNRYILRKPQGEELIFEGFGSEIPQEILNAHKLKPIEIESRPFLLQLGTQLEGPFLLSETAGMKAKMIGMISGAHVIDKALKQANSDLLQISQRQKQLQTDREQVKELLAPFADLDELEARLHSLETRMELVEEKKARLERLRRIFAEVQNIQREKEKEQQILARLGHLDDCIHRYQSVELKAVRFRQLQQNLKKWQETRQEKKKYSYIVEKTDGIDRRETELSQVESKAKRLMELKKYAEQREKVNRDLQEANRFLEATRFVPQADERLRAIEQKKERFYLISRLYSDYQKIQREKEREQKTMVRTEMVPEIDDVRLPALQEKMQRLEILRTKYNELVDCRQRIGIGMEYVKDKERRLDELVGQYEMELRKHGRCPTCGGTIHPEQIREMLTEIRGEMGE
jgi:exonuclease SbcC